MAISRHSPAGSTAGLWAVVLAAGEGTRLHPLTRALYGQDLPKQFAHLDGARSLLQVTLERIAPLVPAERTVVVVARAHHAVARLQLQDYPGIDMVVQPRNLGTGPGLLLPLARILARDRRATVAVFPSDHFVARPERLREVVADAAAAAPRFRLALLGSVPERAESEYGWILPGAPHAAGRAGLRDVIHFVEKPPRHEAARLLAAGGLWNTFVSVGSLAEIWALARTHLKRQARAFEAYAAEVGHPGEKPLLELLYQPMEAADYSRDVLAKADGLAVARLADAGWSDWGSPRRVFEALRGTPAHAHLMNRLAGSSASALAALAGAGVTVPVLRPSLEHV